MKKFGIKVKLESRDMDSDGINVNAKHEHHSHQYHHIKGKRNKPPHSYHFPINSPLLEMTSLLYSSMTLKQSLHKRELLTIFLFIEGTCCMFLSYAILRKVNLYQLCQRHEWKQAIHFPSIEKNLSQLDKKRT